MNEPGHDGVAALGARDVLRRALRRMAPRALASCRAALMVGAAAFVGPATRAEGAQRPSLAATMAVRPPTIDGQIGPEEWTNAAVAQGFLQLEPRRGEPATADTEALVLYDDRRLEVAFRARDDQEPTAQLTQRDADLLGDDCVIVLIDSFDDDRSAYCFATNLLATQADGRIADNGRTVDSTWDATWQSAARRTEDGWVAELAIPLSSLQYQAGEGRAWGLDLGRSRRRNLEVSCWSGPPQSLYQVSAAGALDGLNLPQPLKRLELIPNCLAQAEAGTATVWEAGGDARVAVTTQTAAYLTINPDFATIEADQEQVNLTRYELSLREKRPFFLEGNEQYQQRIRTFYSRRIADIDVGGKLLGKEGPWTFAALDVRSPEIPEAANFSVARLKRDVLGRSSLAIMLSDRGLEGRHQGAIEMDGTLILGDRFNATGQIVRTHGPFEQGRWAFFLRPSYDSSTAHFHVRYTSLGERVADNLNAVGFLVDDDRREVDSALGKTLWRRSGALERLASNSNIYWSQAGRLRSWRIDEGLSADWRNRWTIQVAYAEEFKAFEKDFRNREIGFAVGYNTREYQQVLAGYEFGRNFDSDYRLVTGRVRRKLSSALSAEYELHSCTATTRRSERCSSPSRRVPRRSVSAHPRATPSSSRPRPPSERFVLPWLWLARNRASDRGMREAEGVRSGRGAASHSIRAGAGRRRRQDTGSRVPRKSCDSQMRLQD